jgi:hypothetical protein
MPYQQIKTKRNVDHFKNMGRKRLVCSGIIVVGENAKEKFQSHLATLLVLWLKERRQV